MPCNKKQHEKKEWKEMKEYKVRPIDTLWSYQTTWEAEVLIPKKTR